MIAEPTELQRLFLEQTTKLARVTAVLGVPGDEPAVILEAKARKIAHDRAQLLAAAANVGLCTQASLGVCWVPPAALERLSAAVDSARNEAV